MIDHRKDVKSGVALDSARTIKEEKGLVLVAGNGSYAERATGVVLDCFILSRSNAEL